MLAHRPWPYGVEKKFLSRNSRLMSVAASRNAIDGLPLMISNAEKMRLPARKLGCPHDEVSLVSGNARQSARSFPTIGRDTFALSISERSERLERSERSERPERSERSERSERILDVMVTVR